METMMSIYSGDNNEEYEVQVIKATKILVNGPIDTLMVYAMFEDEYGDDFCFAYIH